MEQSVNASSVSNVSDFVENTKIKRAVIGGFEKESVYSFMQELTSMFQQRISDVSYEKELLEAEAEKAKQNLKNVDLRYEQSLQEAEKELEEKVKGKYEDEMKRMADTCKKGITDVTKEKEEAEAKLRAVEEENRALRQNIEELKSFNGEAARYGVPFEPSAAHLYAVPSSAPVHMPTFETNSFDSATESELLKWELMFKIQKDKQKLVELRRAREGLAAMLSRTDSDLARLETELPQMEKNLVDGSADTEQGTADDDSVIDRLAQRIAQYIV